MPIPRLNESFHLATAKVEFGTGQRGKQRGIQKWKGKGLFQTKDPISRGKLPGLEDRFSKESKVYALYGWGIRQSMVRRVGIGRNLFETIRKANHSILSSSACLEWSDSNYLYIIIIDPCQQPTRLHRSFSILGAPNPVIIL